MVCCIGHPITDFSYSPDDRWVKTVWGRYLPHFTSPDKSVCFKTLVINCGFQISLQYHNHRSEFWFIPDENSHYELTVGEKKEIIRGRKEVNIHVGQKHCIMNMSSIPLIIYETQFAAGTEGRCEEQDIVRLYDPYANLR